MTMPSAPARPRFIELTEEACVALLAGKHVGRIAFVRGGHPDVLPVNYVLHDGAVVFVTAAGSKLDGAMAGPVAFEVDEVDEVTHRAWSVVVHGRAEQVDGYAEPGLVRQMAELSVETWAPGPHPVTVRVLPQFITGRRLQP